MDDSRSYRSGASALPSLGSELLIPDWNYICGALICSSGYVGPKITHYKTKHGLDFGVYEGTLLCDEGHYDYQVNIHRR
jgi:hypothetical protein